MLKLCSDLYSSINDYKVFISDLRISFFSSCSKFWACKVEISEACASLAALRSYISVAWATLVLFKALNLADKLSVAALIARFSD